MKAVWSTEIYKVKSFQYGNYTLEGISNKFFKRNELLPVIKDYIMGAKLKEEADNVPIIKQDNKLIEQIQPRRNPERVVKK